MKMQGVRHLSRRTRAPFDGMAADQIARRSRQQLASRAPAKGRRPADARARSAALQPKGGIQSGNGSQGSRRNIVELRALQSLRLIYASARWHDAQVRRSVAISGSQLWALSEIARWEGMGVNDLAKRMASVSATPAAVPSCPLQTLAGYARDDRLRAGVHSQMRNWRVLQ